MAVKILRLKSKEMEEKSYHRGVTMQISLMGGGGGWGAMLLLDLL